MFSPSHLLVPSRSALLGAVLGLSLLATACSGSDATADPASQVDPTLTGIHAGETAEEHAAHADQDIADLDGEQAMAEALASAAEDDGDSEDGQLADVSGVADETVDTSDPAATDPAITEPSVTDPDVTEPIVTDEGVPNDAEAELAQILPLFGIADVGGAIECISGHADDAGLALEDLTAGAGNGMMLASIRCEPEAMREGLTQAFTEIDTTGMDASEEQLGCAFDTLFDWFQTVPLDEADALFEQDAPDTIIELIADTCDMSIEDANYFLNDA